MNFFSFDQDENTIICGPTSSGKTTLLIDILLKGILQPAPSREGPKKIVICCPPETERNYKENSKLAEVSLPVEFVSTVDGAFNFVKQLSNSSDDGNFVLILDDLGGSLSNKKYKEILDQLFHVTTHHKHLWTFLVTHDLFAAGVLSLRRNTQNYILFDLLQDKFAARQYISKLVGPENLNIFLDCWEYCIRTHPAGKGWIRLDQRLYSEPKRVITGNGIDQASGGVVFHSGNSNDLETSIY